MSVERRFMDSATAENRKYEWCKKNIKEERRDYKYFKELDKRNERRIIRTIMLSAGVFL